MIDLRFGHRILKRILTPLALCLVAAGSLFAAENLRLDANENLFYVMAAANAAGYDEGLNLPDNSPLRKQLRDYLAAQNIRSLPDLKLFYRKHMLRTGTQDLSQYISYAFSIAGPPEFAWKGRDVEVPPDAMLLAGFTPLLIEFYRQAHLDELWQRARPVYEKEIEKYHAPVLKMTNTVDGYLRVPTGGYLGRHFDLSIDLLSAPQQVQTRNYGDDAFVVVTPSETPRLYDIRHAYLHFQLDPIMIKYGLDLKQTSSLLDLVQLAPLEDNYKSDFVLLANESLIKAVESRLDKNPGAIDQAMRQGYILAAHFAEQLPVFEGQQQGMRYFAEDMVKAIDLKREIARVSKVKFDAGPLQRKATQVTVAGPELSPSGKLLEKAEQQYTSRDLEQARQTFQKALEQRGSDEEHAQSWFGLARIAVLQNQPDAAVKLFEKTLGGSPDGFTRGWSYVYLARLAKASNDPDRAAKFYQEALAVKGASERTLDAASKELQSIQVQESPK